MKEKSIKKNVVLNMLRTTMNIIFPLITFPYITRILEADNVGKFDFSKSIVSYFILLSGLGISQYAVREGSSLRRSQKSFEKFCNEVFSINLIMTAISYVILFILLFSSKVLSNYAILISIFSVNIVSNTFSVEWLYTIEEDFKYITIRSFFVQLLSLVLMFIFVKEKNDYVQYALITVFSLGGASLFNFFHSRKYANIQFVLSTNWKIHIVPMLILFFNSIASMIYLNSNITIIGLISGDYYVGIYSTATKIYTIVKQVANAVLLVTIPRLSYLVSAKKGKEYNDLISKILNAITLITIPAMIGIIVLREPIVELLAGVGFERSVYSLSILSLTMIFSLFSSFYIYGVLIPHHKEKNVLKVSIISAVVNVVLNLLFVPFLQEIGAAISIFISELLVMILSIMYSRDYHNKIHLRKNLIVAMIGSIMIYIVCLVLKQVTGSVIIYLFICIFSSIGLYLSLLILTKNELLLLVIPKKFLRK
ncbi:flippase [Vagococcus sp. BWB3-3]|uniref:Flippase n=1 Tax=Vagococcus allomyrinae TaxID=2794353 RepID=A0A940P967_9ENTE|nr:flippase [Vagococcus allomyrinae]MBP1043642.1 flippase [Vagococcus allomyrinae]